MKLFHTTLPTPAGDFSLAVDETGAVVATAFGSPKRLRSRIRGQSAIGNIEWVADAHRTAAARQEVEEYFAGERRDFEVPLAAAGTAFQRRVWDQLRRIPFGQTASYAGLARALKSGPRAVGGANGANPICLLVPCHRVIGSDGSLTGFAFGPAIKRWLLDHERSACDRPRR